MNSELTPSAHPARALPAQPNLEHLKNEAKQRLKALRVQEPHAQLTEIQLAVARDYGFASWRALKTYIDEVTRKRVFAAARAGDVEAVRRAFEGGFIEALPMTMAAPSTRSARTAATRRLSFLPAISRRTAIVQPWWRRQ